MFKGWFKRVLTGEKQHKLAPLRLGGIPEEDMEFITENSLSHCCHAPLKPGPTGGMAQNFWCSKCNARFNLVPGLWGEVTDLGLVDR